jgi:hypothetical protein
MLLKCGDKKFFEMLLALENPSKKLLYSLFLTIVAQQQRLCRHKCGDLNNLVGQRNRTIISNVAKK